MTTSAWDEAKKTKGDEFLQMKKLMPVYSYADERQAVITDKKFCVLLRDELSRSKSLFSDASDWMDKAGLDMHFGRLRDDFDILLDEIEVKAHKWDERIPLEFLEKIMEYDWTLIQKAWALFGDLESLVKELQKVKAGGAGTVRISIDVVNEKTDEIARAFKEREAAFDITSISFRDSFERIRKRIRKSV